MRALVAGLTGQLGSGLIEVLPSTELELVPVLRPQAQRRGRIPLPRQYPDLPPAVLPAVTGDVSQPRWALDDLTVATLRGTIDVVVNLAGETNWAAKRASLHAMNVGGARHGVEVAEAVGVDAPVPYMYASSVFVAGGAVGRVPEQLLGRDGDRTAYEESKWVAEQALLGVRSRERGVPVLVARICPLLGSAATGTTAKRSSLYLLADHWEQLPFEAIPAMTGARVDGLPRDVAARILARLIAVAVENPRRAHGVVHVSAGDGAPTLKGLLETARQLRSTVRTPQRIVPVPRSAILWFSKNAERFVDLSTDWRNAVIGTRYIGLDRVFERNRLAALIGADLPTPSVEQLARLTFGLEAPPLLAHSPSGLARFAG